MNVVEIIDENFKVLRTFSPDHKNIIDVSQPSMRLEWGVPWRIFFEKPEEEVSKRGGHFGAHSCAVDLKVVAIIKSEVIHGENNADEVANSASRNGVMRISAQKIITSINTFIM